MNRMRTYTYEGTVDLKAEWCALTIRKYIDQSDPLCHHTLFMLKVLQTHCSGRSVHLGVTHGST